MQAEKRTVTVEFHGQIALELGEVWPDGDAPETVTADAVRKAMEAEGSKLALLQAWGLAEFVQMRIIVPNPHRTQADALLPEQAPDPVDVAEVWADG